MKQLMMGFAACALMMASCAKQEITESVLDGQGQLAFSTGLGKQSTKAAELMNSSLQTAAATNGIVIHAYQNTGVLWNRWFNDEVVFDPNWRLKNSTRFRNTYPTRYITYFSTVANALTAIPADFATADFTNGKFPKFSYTVAVNAVQEDLIAGITEAAANQKNITLGMRHILSQVNFGTVGYKGANIAIRNIRIAGLFDSAIYTYDDEDKYPIGEWAAHGTNGTAGDRTAAYDYRDHSNGVIADNPQPVAPDTAIKGDVYIFGDGGNWGPGKAATTHYPVGAGGTWVKGDQTLPKQLANSLMLMPQDFANAAEAKVTFEFRITDVDNAYVAGSDTDWEKGEFKLDFSTGTISGTHYLGKWEQNYRYVYLIDFTDFLDGTALTFKVNVEMYPWENYNNGGGDDGIVNIMAAGQPSAANMNAVGFVNGDIWHIASQSETAPNNVIFDPYKWAQVMRDEAWDLSAYDFTQIEEGQTFNLNFQNVIFNTKETPAVDTRIELTLPDGFSAKIATSVTNGEITISGSNPYEISKGDRSANAAITITNESYYRGSDALSTAVTSAAVTTGMKFGYGGTEAVDLKTMEPKLTTAGDKITVKFNTTVEPTVGAIANGTWTWDAANQTATWTK